MATSNRRTHSHKCGAIYSHWSFELICVTLKNDIIVDQTPTIVNISAGICPLFQCVDGTCCLSVTRHASSFWVSPSGDICSIYWPHHANSKVEIQWMLVHLWHAASEIDWFQGLQHDLCHQSCQPHLSLMSTRAASTVKKQQTCMKWMQNPRHPLSRPGMLTNWTQLNEISVWAGRVVRGVWGTENK